MGGAIGSMLGSCHRNLVPVKADPVLQMLSQATTSLEVTLIKDKLDGKNRNKEHNHAVLSKEG